MEQHRLIDQIIVGLISGLVIAIFLGVWKIIHDMIDTNEIIKFLKKSAATTEDTFRSNHAISSEINLSEERVRKLCSNSKKIKRNIKEKESWRLI